MTFNHVGMEIGFLSNIFHIFILRFSKSIMLNTNLDEKIDIVKGDLEEFLEKNLPNLLQLCQLLEPFHHYLQLHFKLELDSIMSEWRLDFLSISSTSLFLDLAKVSCLTLIWMKKLT